MTTDPFADPAADDPADDPADESAGPAPTGHRGVDAAVASLAALADLPVTEHVAVFEAAHDRLRGALADADRAD